MNFLEEYSEEKRALEHKQVEARRTLGTELRKLRKKKGMTLREFARQVGVSASFVSDIELGRRSPSDSMSKRFAEKLKLKWSVN